MASWHGPAHLSRRQVALILGLALLVAVIALTVVYWRAILFAGSAWIFGRALWHYWLPHRRRRKGERGWLAVAVAALVGWFGRSAYEPKGPGWKPCLQCGAPNYRTQSNFCALPCKKLYELGKSAALISGQTDEIGF